MPSARAIVEASLGALPGAREWSAGVLAVGLLAVGLLAAPSVGRAQAATLFDAPSSLPCGQETQAADYGALRLGDEVVLGRHRFVDGDPNWDAGMGRYLGRRASITRLSGVDPTGCPGVRVDVDGGRFFWRVRDLSSPGRARVSAQVSEFEQRCQRGEDDVSYGALRVGSIVVLGRHRAVRGHAAWSAAMQPFVGRVARIVELAGRDDAGCPVIHVDADGRQYAWRVRDLTAGSAQLAGGYRPGLASDHGRPAAPRSSTAPDHRLPQRCGLTDETVDYGPVHVGTVLRLGRHRPVSGVENWNDGQSPYLGLPAEVTELVGVDDQGCALLRVDVDEGQWFWRLRDARL